VMSYSLFHLSEFLRIYYNYPKLNRPNNPDVV
jgi:hypothetical protein